MLSDMELTTFLEKIRHTTSNCHGTFHHMEPRGIDANIISTWLATGRICIETFRLTALLLTQFRMLFTMHRSYNCRTNKPIIQITLDSTKMAIISGILQCKKSYAEFLSWSWYDEIVRSSITNHFKFKCNFSDDSG